MTGPDTARGAALGWLLAYVPLVIVAGGLLAWPVWQMLVAFGLEPEFAEVTLRTMELFALLALLPILRRCGGGGAPAWGYAGASRGAWREFGAGLGAGLAMVAVPALILVALGARDLRELEPADLGIIALKGIITGIAVALLEETWFRGGLATLAQRALGWTPTIVLTSLLYAALHFLDPADVTAADVRPWSGLLVAADVFGGLVIDDYGSALTLLVAGLVLALSRARRGRIYFAIGMHAGWVFVIQSMRRLTRLDRADPDSALAGSYDGVIGWLAAGVFALVLAALIPGRKRAAAR